MPISDSGSCREELIVVQLPRVLVDVLARECLQAGREFGMLVRGPAVQQRGQLLAARRAEASERGLALPGQRERRGFALDARLHRYQAAAGELIDAGSEVGGGHSELFAQSGDADSGLFTDTRE